MQITFLGTGTSFGIPMIGCSCRVCQSESPFNKRLRSSLLVQTKKTCILIDTTPDFRSQALKAGITSLDGVLYTHFHFDHIAGLDDLRALHSYPQNHQYSINIYADASTGMNLSSRFPYCFAGNSNCNNIPRVILREMKHYTPFTIRGIEILPLPVYHGQEIITGFRINRNLAYFSDISLMPDRTRQYLKELDTLILTALRLRPHKKHFSVQEAIEEARKINPGRTFFTHISHMVDHDETSSSLPAKMYLAYDGLNICL